MLRNQLSYNNNANVLIKIITVEHKFQTDIEIRGVPVGLFLPVPVFIVHKYQPVRIGISTSADQGQDPQAVAVLMYKFDVYNTGQLRTVSSAGGSVRVYGSVGVEV